MLLPACLAQLPEYLMLLPESSLLLPEYLPMQQLGGTCPGCRRSRRTPSKSVSLQVSCTSGHLTSTGAIKDCQGQASSCLMLQYLTLLPLMIVKIGTKAMLDTRDMRQGQISDISVCCIVDVLLRR